MRVEPWVWWAAGIALAYGLLRLAGWYMDRLPITADDEYCTCVDDDLNQQVAATIVASRLDAIDTHAMSEQELMEGEFVEDIEAWLAARQTYEAGS
jgi:hypothetical protein